jgi:hypothetical protein
MRSTTPTGATPSRPAWPSISSCGHGDQALAELVAAGAATATADPQLQRWMLQSAAHHPLLDAVDLHGAHDFRHTFSTWLLVELRGFEPLTPCMPSRDPRHDAHHEPSHSRALHQSMRAVVWWFTWVRRAELLRGCCADRLSSVGQEL